MMESKFKIKTMFVINRSTETLLWWTLAKLVPLSEQLFGNEHSANGSATKQRLDVPFQHFNHLLRVWLKSSSRASKKRTWLWWKEQLSMYLMLMLWAQCFHKDPSKQRLNSV